MVTVDGDCRVNKSDENEWRDWRGKKRREGGCGTEEISGGINLEEMDSHRDQLSRGWETDGGLMCISLLIL